MADENDEGSGLDIFEGLGKKNSEKLAVATPPPPPSASSLATVRASADHKRTLMGIPGPANKPSGVPGDRSGFAGSPAPSLGVPPPASTRPSDPPPPQSGSTRTTSDAPPGRGSLPMLAPPKSEPPQRGSGQHRIASDPPHARPKIVKKGVGILDDDDDAADTHVFEKEKVAKAAAHAATMALEATPSTQNEGGSDARTYEQRSAAPLAAPKPSSAPKPVPAPPSDTASLSDAFGALGEPEAGSAIRSAPVSSAMRVVPPPPPGSQKPGLTTAPITQPIPPPPPKGAGMQTMPSAQHGLPPPPSIPPPPITSPLMSASVATAPPPQLRHVAPPASVAPPPPSVYPQSLPPVARPDATYTFPKKEQASNGFIIAVLIAIAAVAGAAVFFFMPRTGGLVVNVADIKGSPVPNLTVTVDGAKRCDSAPCIVRDLAAGTHSVSVAATGFDPVAARAVTVESRKDATTDFSIVASKAVAANGTGFKIAGPAGVKLAVDGKDAGVLPVELKDLEPGDHKLHFAGDRYAVLDKTVTVGNNEIVDMGNIPLKVTKGKATIQLGTPGAKVTLVNGATRKEVPQFPMAIEFDPSEKWTLNATKDGMDPYSEPIGFDDGQAEKTYNIVLTPKGSAKSETATATPKATKAREDDDDAPPKHRPAPVADTSSSSGDTALKLNSLPASSVFVDGNPVGNTPIPHFTVKPGSHTVMFVNSEQSLKKTITVDVKAGETKPAFAKLRDE